MDSTKLNDELNVFETDEMRRYTRDMIELTADYVATIPASTSGKYHSPQQCEEGGLITHIKLATAFMNYILELEYVKKRTTPKKRDMLRCAIMLHDNWKCGINPAFGEYKTEFEHPILAAEWIKTASPIHNIKQSDKNYIANLVATHMGQWNTSKYSSITLKKPKTKEQFLVHLCDYLGSRKNILIS